MKTERLKNGHLDQVHRPGRLWPWAALLIALAALLPARAADNVATNQTASALADLSIEQLMNESVTSVSKKREKLNAAPAAISVVTADDIRRLGITTLPEALRLVPGMDVAQINAHEWAVSARGFNDQFANKLLVLVDGRAVYTPSFGGVFWDVRDVPLDDLDRIEVIRGPGATLWGANAVNGVVNIITKSAQDTQGLLVTADGGTQDQPATTVRYGGQLATNLYYRAYVKYFNRASFVDASGQDTPDAWDSIRGGGRLDWEPSPQDRLTLEGEYYQATLHENADIVSPAPPFWQSVNLTDHDDGGNVLGRWTRDLSDTSQLSVQAYYDHFKEEEASASEIQDTLDLDAQHRFALGGWNDIVWGLDYRYTHFDFPSSFIAFNQKTRNDQLFSGFVQDEITLVPDRLHFTAGTKVEHNDYTGIELEPSARLAWTPTEKQTVWAAVSRAIRTPSIFNLDAQVNQPELPPPPVPVTVSVLPNPNLESEALMAYELGYRIEPVKQLSLDVAGFYNVYDNLIIYVPGTPYFDPNPPPGHLVAPVMTSNGGSGDTYGVEVSAQWQLLANWRLAASYSWLEQRLQPAAYLPETAPEQQAQLRSYLNLTPNLEFNGMVSFVDRITSVNIATPTTISSYVRLDLGLVWRPVKSLELGVWGQNLLQDQHAEFSSDTTTLITEVPRTIVGKITWRF
jgi:iron complex outermembrane recepter protein